MILTATKFIMLHIEALVCKCSAHLVFNKMRMNVLLCLTMYCYAISIKFQLNGFLLEHL